MSPTTIHTMIIAKADTIRTVHKIIIEKEMKGNLDNLKYTVKYLGEIPGTLSSL